MTSDTYLSSKKPLRVLAVDDHEDTLTMLELMLGSVGWNVRTASTAQEALRLLEAERPDVILSDINMPDMDGCEMLRVVRESRGARVPAIAVTGSGLPEDVEVAEAAGFDRCVTKPITLVSLLEAVRSVTGSEI